jgi:hypothetical protein
MDITIKNVPDEIAVELRKMVMHEVVNYISKKPQQFIPKEKLDEAKAEIKSFRDSNKETPKDVK